MGFVLANGVRYPLVGGTRERYFIGTRFKPHKVPENAQSPTSRVHAVLGALTERRPSGLITNTKPILLGNILAFVIFIQITMLGLFSDFSIRTSTIIVPIATKMYRQSPHNK